MKDVPSRDQFAEMVMQALREAGNPQRFLYDLDQFKLVFTGAHGKERSINLHNPYEYFCRLDASSRSEEVGLFAYALSVCLNLPVDFKDARPNLLPVVRSRAYFEPEDMEAFWFSDRLVQRPCQQLGEYLGVGIVYDNAEGMALFRQDLLDHWDVTFEEAMETACANLSRIQCHFTRKGGLYEFSTDDWLDSSRLLLLDQISKMHVQGDPIAMVPCHDNLIVTGSEDMEGLELMCELAEQAFQQPRPVSGTALRLDGDTWKSWLPDANHPHFDRFKLLMMKTLAEEFTQQQRELQQVFVQHGEQICVANYQGARKYDSEISSYGLWTEGVDMLLPRTDDVHFVRGDIFKSGIEVAASARWDRVWEVMGDLMEPVDMYPPRFRARLFPSDEQLARVEVSGQDAEGQKPRELLIAGSGLQSLLFLRLEKEAGRKN